MKHTDTDESRQERRRRGRRYAYIEGWAALVVNILLFGVKYWAGIASGSLAIIADAWHTLSDSFTSLVVLAGTAVGSKPPDREHPFGHERAEVIAALVIGVLLAVLGFNFIVDGVEKLQSGTGAGFGLFAIIVTAGSMVAKEGLAQYAFWAGRRTGNSALHADGWHHRSDAISSLIILIGILAGRSLWWVDGVLATSAAGNVVVRFVGERLQCGSLQIIERHRDVRRVCGLREQLRLATRPGLGREFVSHTCCVLAYLYIIYLMVVRCPHTTTPSVVSSCLVIPIILSGAGVPFVDL